LTFHSLKTYNKYNYYRNTYAVFTEIQESELEFKEWHYLSKSGSAYFYSKEGVFRKSNHWGRAAKCRWVLNKKEGLHFTKGRTFIGFAKWTDFFDNNENSKSYFIKVDFNQKTVTYDHKSRDSQNKNIYRNAKDTQKLIQKVKRILLEDKWAKYYDFEDIEVQRKLLIEELIHN